MTRMFTYPVDRPARQEPCTLAAPGACVLAAVVRGADPAAEVNPVAKRRPGYETMDPSKTIKGTQQVG